MIEISSQMREFVNFAQDAVANDAKNAIARLGAKASRHSAFSIGAATDGDSVGKLRRSGASKNANNTVRTEFRRTVAQMFGGEDRIPENVRAAMSLKDYAKGKPLTADRILDVYAAIKDHIAGLKNAAFENGTLRAVDVADTAADRYLERFQAKFNVRLGAAVASNLKRALILCAANALDDNAVKGGEAAVKKFARTLNASFKYTLTALGFDAESRTVSVRRLESLMKDEVHMRGAVFALLDKDGNADVNRFDARLAIFNDDWLKRESSGLLRANLESPGPAAVKALQAEFTRTARVKVADMAREEVQAFFKANPDKIPAAIRNDKREAQLYVGLVQKYIASKGENEAGARLAAGDANARIDVASALRDFNQFVDSIYAMANGDKEHLNLLERFVERIAFNGAGEPRSLEDIKKKYIDPIRANLEELRAVAGGNAAIFKAGVDALVQSEMAPFKNGILTKLANSAKNLDMTALDSISPRSTPIEIARAFTGVYAQFKKTMRIEDYGDNNRNERNAATLFFAGVVMSRLTGADKDRMFMVFGTKAAGDASNFMQTAITADSGLPQPVKEGMQDAVQMMRQCSVFIADDFKFDADNFAINEIDPKITVDTLPEDVANQFVGLIKEIVKE